MANSDMVRPIVIIIALAVLTLALLPFQVISIAFGLRLQRTLPQFYHRAFCAMIGVRVRQIGRRSGDVPLLILSNHVSWLDISVISALAPVVFIAKSEVAGWPVFGWLAKWQRSIFIERARRRKTVSATQEIAGRLLGGDAVVLFAEGTSSDGTRVLPFRSALVGAVQQALGCSTHHETITVQPLSMAYVGFRGMQMGRAQRDCVAWYGDADLLPHFIGVLSAGAIDVTVTWGEATAYDRRADRKQITRDTEQAVRDLTAAALRPLDQPGTAPASAPPRHLPGPA